MTMVSVTPENLPAAAAVYRESWQESHRSVCTREFLESRDCAGYLRRGLEQGKQFYLLLDPGACRRGVRCRSGDWRFICTAGAAGMRVRHAAAAICHGA